MPVLMLDCTNLLCRCKVEGVALSSCTGGYSNSDVERLMQACRMGGRTLNVAYAEPKQHEQQQAQQQPQAQPKVLPTSPFMHNTSAAEAAYVTSDVTLQL